MTAARGDGTIRRVTGGFASDARYEHRPAVEWARVTLAVAAAAALSGCWASPIRATRLEAALSTTFANLVVIQVSQMGLAPMTAADFYVNPTCTRLARDSETGSGEWNCTLVWLGPDRQTLRDAYDLSVTPDGCYTA